MKTKFTLPFLFALFTFINTTHSQFTKIGVTVGYDTDLVKNLSANYIAGATDLDVSGYDFTSFDHTNVYSMACENAHIRVFTGYDMPRMNASAYFALVGIFNRWDDISYSMDDGSRISFGSLGHEIAGESSIDKRFTLLNFLYLDLGVGANLGVGFGGHSYINTWHYDAVDYGENRDVADVLTGSDVVATAFTSDLTQDGRNKTSLHARAFGKVGAGVIFWDKVEVGTAFRYGYGIRNHIGGSTTPTELISIELNTAYRF